MPKDDPEHREQVALMNWCRTFENIHPELQMIYAIPNAVGFDFKGKQSFIKVKKMKAEGLKSGVLDLHIPIPRDGWAGLWLETKSKTGVVSDAQQWWINKLESYGHKVYVYRDWTIGARIIQKYLGLPYSIVPEQNPGVKRVWGNK